MSDLDTMPASALDPDEPNTPFWLTLLGGALFLAGAIFLLATAKDDPEEPGAQPATAHDVAGSAEAD